MNVVRRLELARETKSVFLFGPRQVGKTTLLKESFPGAPCFDLLRGEVYFSLASRPGAFREQLLARDLRAGATIIVDEIQKLPALLDEVHSLMEERRWRFILTGSSARKITGAGVNLLGGRARTRRLFPFVSAELGEFDLLKVLRFGTLPPIYFSDSPRDDLESYCGTYLQREIADEGLVRAIGPFGRFLRTASLMNGEQVNFESIASDSGVPARTVREYFGILADTLVGGLLEPFKGGSRRKAVSIAKFYLFDVGVANVLAGREVPSLESEATGKALEHFVYTELAAYLDYARDRRELTYWRARGGTEVDFLVGGEVAIEVKATRSPGSRHLKGLAHLSEETRLRRRILVCLAQRPSRIDGVDVLPVKEFLTRLWSGSF